MKKVVFTTLMLSCSVIAFAQWTTKADMSGDGKNHPVTFAIDGFGYAVTGYNTIGGFIYNDGYKYDPSNNSWTPLSPFPGGFRGFAVGASYNGKGYLGFGLSTTAYLNDLWEYDPTNDSWTELAPCPCLGRRHPAFAITSNGKIYVGLGDGLNLGGSFDPGFKDWWEYDIGMDTWSQKTDLPADGRHHPYYFSIGTDVYTGFGDNHTPIFKDFYKYNSLTEQWTVLNDFPGESRVAGAQFSHNGFGYIVDGEGSNHGNLDEGELHRYDPNSDTWTTLAFHSGDGLWAPGAFVIDDMAYVVGGDLDNDVSLSTLWAYSLEDTPVDNALTNSVGEISLSSDFFDENASFQWVDCDNNFAPLAGETNSLITIPPESSYALIVTYSEGGVDTSDCYENLTVSIEEEPFQSDYSFSVFPNPLKDRVHIQRQNDFNENLEYIIVNGLGIEVGKGDFVGANCDIDVSSLANGMYFVFIRSEGKKLESVLKIEKID